MLTIPNPSARRVLLQLQGLSQSPADQLRKDDLFDLICQLGLVQVDSIRCVERAHHMILFSRNQNYRPNLLRELAEDDRLLFENYTHDASFIPAKYFRYWRHRFARDRNRLRESMIRWQGDGFVPHCARLQRMIRRRGAVRSRDLKHTSGKNTDEMWQWHDGKAALEYLWRTGKLGIASRDGFQKVYDLIERVIGPEDLANRCSRAEFIDWSCRSALKRLGIASTAQLADFWKHVSIAEVKRWLSRQKGSVVQPVLVVRDDGTMSDTLYARADMEALMEQAPKPPTRVRALSPFDPLIRNRDRLSRLFGFDYRIEIYVPEAKRKYGYYVFPLLEGDKFIGRIDMRADRDAGALEVKKLWMETRFELTPARRKRLDGELARVAKFADLKNVNWRSRK